MKHLMIMLLSIAVIWVFASGCECKKEKSKAEISPAHLETLKTDGTKEVTPQNAEKFMEKTETQLLQLWISNERAMWVKNTNITHDTDILAAEANERLMTFVAQKAAQATRFDNLELSDKLRRKFNLLKMSLSVPAPSNNKMTKELATILARMESTYAKGKYCPEGKETCLTLGVMSRMMASIQDYDKLLDIWQGWRTISPPIKDDYARFVEISNSGAKELGFDDLGQLWKSKYDMKPDDFESLTDKIWQQLKPLYEDLHCYVRSALTKKYGEELVPSNGPIPAHLLGNMWAQSWGNIYNLVEPEKGASCNFSRVLNEKNYNEEKMVKTAENFFVSLGLEKLPRTFWERSMFKRPADREVVCHASAWDIDWKDDLRIKMCIEINEEDFVTIHHELGHNYYQRAYKNLDPIFTNSANDGFHEALGDLIALSVTPSYLKEIGLIDELPTSSLNSLMKKALGKVAFLPFGLMIDKWRYDVFSGKVKKDEYNSHWWKLRTKYQGIKAPDQRPEDAFDPGAKFHIPSAVPYTRYFLADIYQFQFHRDLCRQIGYEGPLHTCSIYNNKEAGKKIDDMMKMGLSKPWPLALEAITGEKEIDASAIIQYFEPLAKWLKEQNKDQKCGW